MAFLKTSPITFCVSCFDLLLPCNGGTPCKHCQDNSIDCQYLVKSTKRGPKPGYHKYLSSIIANLEAQVKQHVENMASTRPVERLDSNRVKESPAAIFPQLELETPVDDNTEQSKPLDKSLVRVYFRDFGPRTGLLEESIFMDLLQTETPNYLLNVMYTLAHTTAKRPSITAYTKHYARARHVASLLVTPSLWDVCGLYLFCIHAAGVGKTADAEMALVTALRLAQNLELTKESNLSLFPQTWATEVSRRVVWKLGELDLMLSFRSSLPFIAKLSELCTGLPGYDLVISKTKSHFVAMKDHSISSSLANPHCHPCIAQVVSYHIPLLTILADVITIMKRDRSPPTLFSFQQQLAYWFRRLPVWMQGLVEKHNIAIPHEVASAAYQTLIIYAFTQMCLMGRRTLQIITTDPYNSMRYQEVNYCAQGARIMTHCLSALLTIQPNLNLIPSYLDNLVFYGALVHLLSFHGNRSLDPNVIQEFCRTHRHFLDILSRQWSPAVSCIKLLDQIVYDNPRFRLDQLDSVFGSLLY